MEQGSLYKHLVTKKVRKVKNPLKRFVIWRCKRGVRNYYNNVLLEVLWRNCDSVHQVVAKLDPGCRSQFFAELKNTNNTDKALIEALWKNTNGLVEVLIKLSWQDIASVKKVFYPSWLDNVDQENKDILRALLGDLDLEKQIKPIKSNG
jgi:hypothetical protein